MNLFNLEGKVIDVILTGGVKYRGKVVLWDKLLVLKGMGKMEGDIVIEPSTIISCFIPQTELPLSQDEPPTDPFLDPIHKARFKAEQELEQVKDHLQTPSLDRGAQVSYGYPTKLQRPPEPDKDT